MTKRITHEERVKKAVEEIKIRYKGACYERLRNGAELTPFSYRDGHYHGLSEMEMIESHGRALNAILQDVSRLYEKVFDVKTDDELMREAEEEVTQEEKDERTVREEREERKRIRELKKSNQTNIQEESAS